jgi:hypothetical protein
MVLRSVLRGVVVAAIGAGAPSVVAAAPRPRQEPPPQEKPAQEKPPQAAPAQEKPPAGSSKALDELLERLLKEQGGQPPVVAPSDVALPPDVALAGAPPAESRLARVTRISDTVQVVRADGSHRDLQYWDKFLDVGAGDEVRQQGGRSLTLLDYADGAHFRFDGEAIWRLTSDALAKPRRFEIVRLARHGELWFGRNGLDTVVMLPGGNELAGNGTRVRLRDFDGRALEVTVTGPTPAVVRSPYLAGRIVTVLAGQRILLPVLTEPSAVVSHLTREATLFDVPRGQLRVQAPDQLTLTASASDIELLGSGPIPGIARACGARVVVQPGRVLRLTRAALGAPRRQEWDE